MSEGDIQREDKVYLSARRDRRRFSGHCTWACVFVCVCVCVLGLYGVCTGGEDMGVRWLNGCVRMGWTYECEYISAWMCGFVALCECACEYV